MCLTPILRFLYVMQYILSFSLKTTRNGEKKLDRVRIFWRVDSELDGKFYEKHNQALIVDNFPASMWS